MHRSNLFLFFLLLCSCLQTKPFFTLRSIDIDNGFVDNEGIPQATPHAYEIHWGEDAETVTYVLTDGVAGTPFYSCAEGENWMVSPRNEVSISLPVLAQNESHTVTDRFSDCEPLQEDVECSEEIETNIRGLRIVKENPDDKQSTDIIALKTGRDMPYRVELAYVNYGLTDEQLRFTYYVETSENTIEGSYEGIREILPVENSHGDCD